MLLVVAWFGLRVTGRFRAGHASERIEEPIGRLGAGCCTCGLPVGVGSDVAADAGPLPSEPSASIGVWDSGSVLLTELLEMPESDARTEALAVFAEPDSGNSSRSLAYAKAAEASRARSWAQHFEDNLSILRGNALDDESEETGVVKDWPPRVRWDDLAPALDPLELLAAQKADVVAEASALDLAEAMRGYVDPHVPHVLTSTSGGAFRFTRPIEDGIPVFDAPINPTG